jgi:hypothetical protein
LNLGLQERLLELPYQVLLAMQKLQVLLLELLMEEQSFRQLVLRQELLLLELQRQVRLHELLEVQKMLA